MNAPLPEPVRLVVWDLDETFWHGTLSEGGIEYRQDLHDAVIALAQRGIVSSICSKNDEAAVRAELQRHGLWEYFVFPSIDWGPKGPRLAALVEAVQLRAPTVLFIDDNPHNLAEARHFVAGIQLAGPEILPGLLENPLLRGKDDAALTRLAQYRLLQRRQTEAAAAGDATDFLRASNITVEIDFDVARHLDRAIELINRTNQLNFCKRRLPENPDEARAALTAVLRDHNQYGGILRVRDNYGDYGYCGLFVLRHARGEPKTLLQFCFSCRILNMGVESWLYQRLGRPRLDVVGEVLSDVVGDTSTVDWINVSGPGAAPTAARALLLDDVYMRGACHVRPMAHYFATVAETVHEEFDTVRDGRTMALHHTVFANYAIHGVPPAARAALLALGYQEADFGSFITRATAGRRGLWVLNFWTELGGILYRHRASGALIPVQFNPGAHARMVRKLGRDALDARNWDAAEAGVDPAALDFLRAEFDYVGATPEDLLHRNIADMLRQVPAGTRVFVLLANEVTMRPDGQLGPAEICKRINRMVRAAVAPFPAVSLLDVRDCIQGNDDLVQGQPLKLTRAVQFRIYEEILRRYEATAKAA
jgi:FkbH-like protein